MKQNKFKAIVFDWGDTLMRVFPDQGGAMRNWEQVEMIPFADHTLAYLAKQTPIFVATNAQDSSAEDVRAALDRVNLGKYIQKIVTSADLGTKKPDALFFTQISNDLQIAPDQLIYIGDDYQKDILPAWSAGWQTCWFNPSNLFAKAHYPVHQYECFQLNELPNLLEKPALPSLQTCLSWYAQQQFTHSLLEHVQTVAAAAYQMAVWLRTSQPHVSPLLTHRGAFLHDLAKLTETKEKNHAELAEEILQSYHQPELAKIAGRHLMGDLQFEDRRPFTWEEKLVHYADKLAEGNSLVSLSTRLAALKNRYPLYAEKIERHRPLIEALQNEICEALSTTPDKLLSDLQSALFNGDKSIN